MIEFFRFCFAATVVVMMIAFTTVFTGFVAKAFWEGLKFGWNLLT